MDNPVSDLNVGEECLRQMLQNMPVMLNAFDHDGVYVAWNRECEIVTRYAASEMVGSPRVLEVVVPQTAYRERMLAKWDVKGDHRNWHWQFTSKDGGAPTIAWSNISTNFPVPSCTRRQTLAGAATPHSPPNSSTSGISPCGLRSPIPLRPPPTPLQ